MEERLTRWCRHWISRRVWLLWCFQFQIASRKNRCHFPQRERRSTTHLPQTGRCQTLDLAIPEQRSDWRLRMLNRGLTVCQGAGAQCKEKQQGEHSDEGAQTQPWQWGISWIQFVVADLSVQSHAQGLITKINAPESRAAHHSKQFRRWGGCWNKQASSLTCRWNPCIRPSAAEHVLALWHSGIYLRCPHLREKSRLAAYVSKTIQYKGVFHCCGFVFLPLVLDYGHHDGEQGRKNNFKLRKNIRLLLRQKKS